VVGRELPEEANPVSLPSVQDLQKQRQEPVYATNVEFRFFFSSEEAKMGLARKISLSALFFDSDQEFLSGMDIVVEFQFLKKFQDLTSFQVKGKVVEKSGESSPFSYHLMFSEMEEETRGFLIEFISQLLLGGKAFSLSKVS